MNISQVNRVICGVSSFGYAKPLCSVVVYLSLVVGAFAQVCEPYEHNATKCVKTIGQYGIKRIFWFSESNGTAYEFVNECTERVRVMATFDSGRTTLSVGISAKKSGDDDEPRRGKIVCDGNNQCGKLGRVIACSQRAIEPLVATAPPQLPSVSNEPVAVPAPMPNQPVLPSVISPPVVATVTPAPAPPAPSPVAPAVAPPPAPSTPAPATAAAVTMPLLPKPEFVVRQNWDLVGTLLKSLSGIGPDECKKACFAEAACVGYTADRWNSSCFLKSSAVSARIEPKATSGWKDNLNPALSVAALAIEPYKQRKLEGREIDSRTAVSLNQCQSSCSDADLCVGFSFVASSRQCVRFQQVNNHVRDENFQSGIKRQPEPANR